MPQFIRAAGYKIYFWSNETNEPVHFHATKGDPSENDTKIWLLKNGSLKLAHNKGHIPEKDLSKTFFNYANLLFRICSILEDIF